MIKSERKNCNSSHCIAFGSEFNEKFQKNWIFFSRSPLRHLISNSVGSSILCSAAINFNTSLAAAVQSKRLHNGVKTILLCQKILPYQNYFIGKSCPFFQKVWCIFLIAQKMCRKLSWKRYLEIVFCLKSADSNCTAVSKEGKFKMQSLG